MKLIKLINNMVVMGLVTGMVVGLVNMLNKIVLLVVKEKE
jgi:hypothetical protein